MSQSNHDVLSAAHPQDWARAEHLLPGSLKKTLSASDQEWMNQWTTKIETAGGPVADALVSETEWIRTTQVVLNKEAENFNADIGWQKLQAGLQREMTPEAAPSGAVISKLRQWLTKLEVMQRDRALQWWQKPVTGVLASAMFVGQMGLLAATVKQLQVMTTEVATVTLSSGASRPVNGTVLKVIFKANASVSDIQTILNSVQAHVTGGPGALGIWDVEVDTDKLQTALDLFGRSKVVESVAQE